MSSKQEPSQIFFHVYKSHETTSPWSQIVLSKCLVPCLLGLEKVKFVTLYIQPRSTTRTQRKYRTNLYKSAPRVLWFFDGYRTLTSTKAWKINSVFGRPLQKLTKSKEFLITLLGSQKGLYAEQRKIHLFYRAPFTLAQNSYVFKQNSLCPTSSRQQLRCPCRLC